MAFISSKKSTIQHFTHGHPLTQLSANTEFLCGGCRTLGNGTRYRCEPCNFDLHDYCGTCPTEIFSSFLHQQHDLKLVNIVCELQQERVCDLCDDPVEGLLFYRCEECDFDVHPLCTQLPKELVHVMHKDHPLALRLQSGSIHPGTCMVCKGTCTSWHYRCGICCFYLHIECVLAPCDQEKATATTSTPRSLNTPIPPPSPNSPLFDLYHGHGYGAITPPPAIHPYWAPYGAGVPFGPPYFGPYGHGYGAIRPPPPYNWAYGYGVPFGPPNFSPYSYAHGYGVPYYSSGIYHVNSQHANANSSQIQGSNGVYNANSQHSNINSSQNQGSSSSTGGGKVRKKIYAIVGTLGLGVLSNAVSDVIL